MITITAVAKVEPLSGKVKKQMPFAIALALTLTAKDGQAEVQKQLPTRFHLKNGWTVRNIRVEAARKNLLIAAVTAPEYMAKQEAGGTRSPTSGDHLATPGASLQGRIIPRGSRPGAVFGKPRTFKLFGKGGSEAIAQRTGKKGRAFKILYWLTDTQDYDQRFDMGPTVAGVVERRFASRLGEAMSKAMATAR